MRRGQRGTTQDGSHFRGLADELAFRFFRGRAPERKVRSSPNWRDTFEGGTVSLRPEQPQSPFGAVEHVIR